MYEYIYYIKKFVRFYACYVEKLYLCISLKNKTKQYAKTNRIYQDAWCR